MDEQEIKLIKEKFVAVDHPGGRLSWEDENWWATVPIRFEDACGDKSGYGSNTWHFVTASGKPIRRGAGKGLEGVLEEFAKLPEADRRGYGETKPDEKMLKLGPMRLSPEFPPGGLALRTYQRPVKQTANGDFALRKVAIWNLTLQGDLVNAEGNHSRDGKPAVFGDDQPAGDPAQDTLWMTQHEWQALVPANPKKGDTIALPDSLTRRIACYGLFTWHAQLSHAANFWQGWPAAYLRKGELGLTVVEVTDAALVMRLQGSVLLTRPAGEAAASDANLDARFHGVLAYDRAKKAFTRFDMVALGEQWGSWIAPVFDDHRTERVQVGFAFELATGEWAWDYNLPWALKMSPKGSQDADYYAGKP